MRYSFLLVTLLLNVIASAQKNELSWYKMLSGTIDKYPVTIYLHKAGHEYRGHYYYQSQQLPISFYGEDTTKKGKISLTSYGDGITEEYFEFAITPGGAAGTWQKKPGAKALNFTATEVKMQPAFGYVYSKGSAKLRPKLKESPEATVSDAAVWPLGKTPADERLKKLIRHMFDEDYVGNEEIGALFLKSRRDYFTEYKNENKDVPDADLADARYSYSTEFASSLTVVHHTSKLLNLAYYTYSYMGGAHGLQSTAYRVVDVEKGTVLNYSDIINEAGQKAMGTLIEKYFRAQYKLKPTDSLQSAGLSENFIKPTENVFLTGKVLGFCFTPYEIGPYAMGEIEICIPLKELEPYLKPGVKKLVEE